MKEDNIIDIGFSDTWQDGSLEKRLVEMTERAGCSFEKDDTHPAFSTFTCYEAGIRYHTKHV